MSCVARVLKEVVAVVLVITISGDGRVILVKVVSTMVLVIKAVVALSTNSVVTVGREIVCVAVVVVNELVILVETIPVTVTGNVLVVNV